MKKKVFITGASSGIGEYLAYAYAKQGFFIGLVARRKERLDLVATQCSEFGGQTKVYAVDVLNGSDCKKAIDDFIRSEERRVGKECRSRWSPYH
mgnify:CR=1 FL=1